jgi:exonuclease VII small subunit
MSSEDALARAEELLGRLEAARMRLEQTEDAEQAIEILAELSELAKQVEGELQRARRQAGAGA